MTQSSKKIKKMSGDLRLNYPLAKHTSWRIGGLAKHCYFPSDLDDLAFCFQKKLLPKPYTWLGLGSNVLIHDGGIKGTVVMTLGCLQKMESMSAGQVTVQAGVTCAKFARYCASQGMHGAAFFAGIPGTIGGALAMNAGAFGGVTWPHVVVADMLSEDGTLSRYRPEDFDIKYREVGHPGASQQWFVGATFAFPQGDVEAEKKAIRKTLKERSASQPIGALSCGSVFKNPENDHAARLIESCGMKGYRRGGAVVSEKHANFIINDANSSAADVAALIDDIQSKVRLDTGIELELEVRIIGESL